MEAGNGARLLKMFHLPTEFPLYREEYENYIIYYYYKWHQCLLLYKVTITRLENKESVFISLLLQKRYNCVQKCCKIAKLQKKHMPRRVLWVGFQSQVKPLRFHSVCMRNELRLNAHLVHTLRHAFMVS